MKKRAFITAILLIFSLLLCLSSCEPVDKSYASTQSETASEPKKVKKAQEKSITTQNVICNTFPCRIVSSSLSNYYLRFRYRRTPTMRPPVITAMTTANAV